MSDRRDESDQRNTGAEDITRRQALQRAGLLSASWILAEMGGMSGALSNVLPSDEHPGGMPRRPLGKTGVMVPIMGIGGGHLIRQSDEEGERIVHEAIDAGLTFMDNAWDYQNNRSEEVMGKALAGKRHQVFLMTKMCTHGRGKKVGMLHLDQSLRRLRTDYLDLWQIHEVGCADDAERIFQQGGAAEALLQAKQQGKVRFIGFTGHTDPAVHLSILARRFPFDTCQLPLNVFDAGFRSFEQQVLPELHAQGIAPIAMKSLCGNGKPVSNGVISAEEAMRYTLSLPVATLVSGIDSLKVLRQNLRIAQTFVPMTSVEMDALRRRASAEAAGGRYETYKTRSLWSCDKAAADHRFGRLEQS